MELRVQLYHVPLQAIQALRGHVHVQLDTKVPHLLILLGHGSVVLIAPLDSGAPQGDLSVYVQTSHAQVWGILHRPESANVM